jgi:fructosamine-3-kinase
MSDLDTVILHLQLFFKAECLYDHTVRIPSRTGSVHKLRFGEKTYSLKIYEKGNYYGDLAFSVASQDHGLPVPTVHSYDDSGSVISLPWIVRDWIESEQSDPKPYRLGESIGFCLQKIHAIPVDGAGAFEKNGWQFEKWTEFIASTTQAALKSARSLPEDEPFKRTLKTVALEAEKLSSVLPGTSLLHGDLNLENILYDNSEVRGLIDTGWCIGGDPILDIATFLNSSKVTTDHEAGFRKAYGKKMPDEYLLSVFRMFLLLDKLQHNHRIGSTELYQEKKAQFLSLYKSLF